MSSSNRTPKYQSHYQKTPEGLRYREARLNSLSKDENKEVTADDSVSVAGVS